MEKKAISGIMLTLLLTSMFTFAFNALPIKATSTVFSVVKTRILEQGDDLIHGFVYYEGYLWASTRTSPCRILKIDPETLDYERIILDAGLDDGEDLIATDGYIWVILYTSPSKIIRVDPETLAWEVAVSFQSDELSNGGSLEYAFGYLWTGGSNGKIAKIDLRTLTYVIYSYSIVEGYTYTAGLTSGGDYLWGSCPHSSWWEGWYADTIVKINQSNPSDYTSVYISTLMCDDMAYVGGYLYTASEKSPSYVYKISDSLTYSSAKAGDTVCYGIFAHNSSIWGAYAGSPGKVVELDSNLSIKSTYQLPLGFNDANEIAFDTAGNMYVTCWESPAKIVKLSPPIPDFSITASLTSLTIRQGDSDTSVITITSINNFNQPVQLTVSGAPSGVTTSLNPEQVTSPPDDSTTATLTISVGTTATPGSYTLTVTGTNGTLTRSVNIYLEITALPPSVPRFLTLPFKDVDIRVRQGWRYDAPIGPDPEGPYAHNGIDYIKEDARGNWLSFDVVAAADGMVVQSSGGGYGTFVYIRHDEKDSAGNNYFTLYAHLDSVATGIVSKPRGSTDYTSWTPVKRGDFIGKAGTTGVADPTWIHLHFEVQRGGYPYGKTDPYDLYKTRIYYPRAWLRLGEENEYTNSGPNYLWTTDPPSLPPVNQLPVAVAGLDQSVSSGDLVTFDGSNSYDPDGTIVSYRWNFEDGTTAEGKNVSHRFRGAMDQSKSYNASLTVEDDKSVISTDTIHVLVEPLKKTVEVTRIPNTPLGVEAYARMTVSYNWVETVDGENVYIISRVRVSSGGFTGGYSFFIMGSHSRSKPLVTWWDFLPAGLGEVYASPFPTHVPLAFSRLFPNWKPRSPELRFYGEDFFEGFVVRGSDLMMIRAAGWPAGIYFGTDPIVLLYRMLATTFFVEDSTYLEPGRSEQPPVLIDINDFNLAHLASPGELRVYDLEGRVAGLVNGAVREEIPNSVYSNNTVMILSPGGSYSYEVAGTEDGSYGLLVASFKQGKSNTFTATDIQISINAIHQHTIDWDAISRGEEGVTVKVDSDGDGVFELTFSSDSELTQDEFMQQVSPVEAFPMWILGVAIAMVTVITVAVAVFRRRRKQPPTRE